MEKSVVLQVETKPTVYEDCDGASTQEDSEHFFSIAVRGVSDVG